MRTSRLGIPLMEGQVGEELGEQGSGPQLQTLLRLLGLGVRARNVAVGVERARAAVQQGTAALVVVASDIAHHSRAKIVPLAKARSVTLVVGPDSRLLGGVCGRDQAVALAVLDTSLARGLLAAIENEASHGGR